MLCLLINGVNLKGTCFAIDFTFGDTDTDELSAFIPKEGEEVGRRLYTKNQASDNQNARSSVIINLINQEVLQLETRDSVTSKKISQLQRFIEENSGVLKLMIKQYLFNNLV